MKRLLIALALIAGTLSAQGTAWTTFTPQTASTNLAGGVDSKINWQTGSGAPSGLFGTIGKDFYTDTATGYVYGVTVTGVSPTPATWARTSVHPPLVSGDIPNNAANTSGNAATATALAALPTPCSTGSAPTGILANGNSTGCASIGGGSTPCKVSFTAFGGSIASLHYSGCITGVTYVSAGNYTLTLSSPPTNWVLTCAAGDTGVNWITCGDGDSTPQQSNTSTLLVTYATNGTGFLDPKIIYAVIQ